MTRTQGLWALVTLAITVGFGRLAGHNLANYRPWSNDEGELIAVGYKLATHGVLGSDMYAGFFGGDQHHLETLPLQHVLQAICFCLLGPGVAQARLVSLLAAVVVIWLVGWLALRWYGLTASILSELLLVAWRSNLTAASDGLPLLGVARTARYDILAVAAVWLAIAALDATLRKPTPIGGLLTGFCSGLAVLSQFFGVFVLPLVLIGWKVNRRQPCRASPGRWIIVGFVLPIAAYAVYAARYSSDLMGQLTVYGNRGNLFAPGFLQNNIVTETARYAQLVTGWPPALDASGTQLSDSPFSPWLLVLGLWPSLTYIAWRARQRRALGDRLLVCSLACFGGSLLLLDQTKTPLYAILLLPSICVSLSAGCVALVASSWLHWRQFWARTIVVIAVAAVCISMTLEGIHAFVVDWFQAATVTPYLALGEQIDAALTPGSSVLGPERWWWALHSHPYLSLRNIWFQWSTLDNAGGSPQFADWVLLTRPKSIIVNINVRDDVRAFPQPLQDQFWTFMDRCTRQAADIPNPNYFETEIYDVIDGCR